MKLGAKYPNLNALLASKDEAKAEPETKVVKNFRHKGQDYSIIEKDPGGLKKKLFVFQIDGETFSNNGRGWPSAQDTMLAIKQYVREPEREAVAAIIDQVLAEGEFDAPETDSEGLTTKLDPAMGSKKYEVHVAHDASIYCLVTLNANSPEEAADHAFEMARNGELNWALSEGNPTDDPYLPNDDSVEEN